MNQKVQNALRSLFRYKEISTKGYPDILLWNEKNLLARHLSELTMEEIQYVSKNYVNYVEKSEIDTFIADFSLSKELDRRIFDVN